MDSDDYHSCDDDVPLCTQYSIRCFQTVSLNIQRVIKEVLYP
ncbi:hypothetical protein QA601_12435 [Chitinispirillales bacterium ANBcel5]|nr:hypothetical protein [Chitinispirillales bacterium ANBcel5]